MPLRRPSTFTAVANGVEATLLPTLSEEETIALENSARILREAAGATL